MKDRNRAAERNTGRQREWRAILKESERDKKRENSE